MQIITKIMPRPHSRAASNEAIFIKGARLHNLKNIDVSIPRNKLVVITGLSGSGKSSLAFDTLYAEGQRRYVESLSSYARQFLGRLNKPLVDYIKGISPAVAIEQKVNTTNPRSTVGTSTEIYDYLKLLFARIGVTVSPETGKVVQKDSVSDVVDFVKSAKESTKLLLLSKIILEEDRKLEDKFKVLQQLGFSRLKHNNEIVRIEEALQMESPKGEWFIVIDRIVVQNDENFLNRLADAVDMAFYEGKGRCIVENLEDQTSHQFSNFFESDGVTFLEPNVHLFSFNNPYGACPVCEGYGDVIGIDESLVVPNTSLSVFDDAIVPWRSDSMKKYKNKLIAQAEANDFPIHRPYYKLTPEQKKLLWEGNKTFKGINSFFDYLESKVYKIQNRVMLSRFRGKTVCQSCQGTRLRVEANAVKVGGKSLPELVLLPVDRLIVFFNELQLDPHHQDIAKRLLHEIRSRLSFLSKVGLNYLTLNRKSNSLSGGESQRINLATALGSSLVGSMYILDEPSIGLHPKDSQKLIEVLKELRDIGNTVIVVEHDEDIIRQADAIIDIGPEAGTFGGEVVSQGNLEQLMASNSLTAQYLNGTRVIESRARRSVDGAHISLEGARVHNLKNIDVVFPLNCLTVVTGVSGSGKSTLVRKILYPALQIALGGYGEKPGEHTSLSGSFSHIKQVEFVNQNPIGRSSRSNPVTYIKAYDDIRSLYARQPLSKQRKFATKHFSFNVDGGRCDNCKGEGSVTIEMQFMADVQLECEVCKGQRFKKEVLDVQFIGKSITDVLDMTIDDAISFFEEHRETKIKNRLLPLQEVGLGYVTLGQSSSTLSGGEAQRIKLASFLGKGQQSDSHLFIFDEPTTGLHFHDIQKLLKSFDALIDNGHSVIVVEHNLDLIKCADYIIDLGPEGGENGGYVVCSGSPMEVAHQDNSATGVYLKEKIRAAIR